jgi:hypothetical protein
MGLFDLTPAPSSVRTDKSAVEVPPEGAYLTDGTMLLRVASQFADLEGNPLLELEDCRTLELVLCPARRIAALRLRLVSPTVTAAGV